MKKYSDLLKDPRWQKKRLEIFKRDDWKCQICGKSNKTLHVHHESYCESGMPWDTPDYDLITMCEECHDNISYPIDIRTTRDSFNIRYFVDKICKGEPRKYFEKIHFYKGQVTVKLRDTKLTPREFANILCVLAKLKKFIEDNCECLLEIDDGLKSHHIDEFIKYPKDIYDYGS